jgi:hypothetical protein
LFLPSCFPSRSTLLQGSNAGLRVDEAEHRRLHVPLALPQAHHRQGALLFSVSSLVCSSVLAAVLVSSLFIHLR